MIRPEKLSDAVTLYEGDCLDVLPTLTGVDAVVTDPPYGIGFKYESHDDTPEGYGKFIWSVMELAESKCNPGSPIFVWQTMLNVRKFPEWFPRDFRIFAAAKNFVQIRPHAMQNAYDPVVVWWTEGKRWWPNDGTVTRDFCIGNTAGVISNRGNAEKGHPCPRPLDHLTYVVRAWCRPDGAILDPFAGSGTTGIAAAIEGRRAILIEKDPHYCDIIRRRIADAEATGPGSLFKNVKHPELFAGTEAT